jgi:hypothetical protein
MNKTEEFIKKAKLKHGDKYDYSKVEYLTSKTKVIIICKIHGDFEQSPNSHISQKQGCPKCNPCGYSKKAIKYLNFIATYNNILIQHAENNSEYIIPTTKCKADGFCAETNTIYEFHGTVYHGDPRVCNTNEYNYLGKKYGELYEKTLEREKMIKELGYQLVVMWEYDWDKINKSIKTLQKNFKSFH